MVGNIIFNCSGFVNGTLMVGKSLQHSLSPGLNQRKKWTKSGCSHDIKIHNFSAGSEAYKSGQNLVFFYNSESSSQQAVSGQRKYQQKLSLVGSEVWLGKNK